MSPIPFVVGQWVRGDRFYGRTGLIEEVLHGNRDSLWLLGTRRVGKTSLLRQIEHLTADGENGGYFPLFWDFQGAEDPDELHQLFLDALLDAEDRLEAIGLDSESLEGRTLFASLNALRRKVRSSGRKLLLLCDEVEELIKIHAEHSSLLAKLRRALQSQEDIRSVLASSIRLWKLADVHGDTSPFLHGFAPPLYINRMSEDEARALVRQDRLPSSSRPTIDDAVVEEICRHCDGHPYLIQIVCKRFLEQGDVEEAIEQVAADPMVSFFFSVDFEMLSEKEQDVVRVIAESTAANSQSIQGRLGLDQDGLSGMLHQLQHLGYVRRTAEQRFELANFFFRRWLASHPGSVSANVRPVADLAPANINSDQTQLVFDDRYELQRKIGDGMFGVVYKARDRALEEIIAIKVLRSAYCGHEQILERFRQEVLLSRDIGHPNILRIYHLGDWRGRKYLTMKWIAGPTLGGLIGQGEPLAVSRWIAITRKLASALEAAHDAKVLHRDIKPQNVLLDERDEPYLTDFGLARLLDAPSMTGSGIFVGTPDYASPEQANLIELDPRSDLYSLGVVMFEMAAGRKPFVADSVSATLQLHRKASPPDPRQFRPDLPQGVAQIILRCLQKDPAERFSGARELREELEGLEVRE